MTETLIKETVAALHAKWSKDFNALVAIKLSLILVRKYAVTVLGLGNMDVMTAT